jgi:hypothetical protein
MASCEKCWADSLGPFGDQVDRYHRLIKERNCTPEEQAGPDAGWCDKCERKTIHQNAKVCTICHVEKKGPRVRISIPVVLPPRLGIFMSTGNPDGFTDLFTWNGEEEG